MDIHLVISRLKDLASELGRTPTKEEFLASGVSEYVIRKKGGFTVLLQAAGMPTYHKHVNDASAVIILPQKPFKILHVDIETSIMKVHSFALGDQYLQINQIEKDWKILSFAAKFEDEETIHYLDLRHEPDFDDAMILTALQHLFSKASVVVGHNAASFDVKKINARMIKHGMEPIQDYKVIDTLKIARKHFKFTSNKLEYLAKFLGCTPKSKHKKFHGLELWQECEKHNPEAWAEIELYNKQDVYTLAEVWHKLRKWDNSKLGRMVNDVLSRRID